MKRKSYNTGKNVAKTVVHAAIFTGAGAATTALFKNTDMSGVRGIAKLCLGGGIMAISHWVGNEAAKTIDDELEGITKLLESVLVKDEEEEDVEFEDDEEGDA